MGNYLPEVSLGTGLTALEVYTGLSHTCVITDDDNLKCWGKNNYGQLGQESIFTIGDNSSELGNYLTNIDLSFFDVELCTDLAPTFTPTSNPTMDPTISHAPSTPPTIPPTFDPTFTPTFDPTLSPSFYFSEYSTCRSTFTKGEHNCVLFKDKKVKCWGNNGQNGVLGYEDAVIRGDLAGQMSDYLPYLNIPSISTLAAGTAHTCAISDTFSVYCWGRGLEGGLGTENIKNVGNATGEMGDYLIATNIGPSHLLPAVIQSGDEMTCIATMEAKVKCWGDNKFGQLGYGDTLNRGDDANEMGNNLPFLNFASAAYDPNLLAIGHSHSCVILNDITFQLKCWGANGNGKLGYEDTTNRGKLAGQMGDYLPPVNVGAEDPMFVSLGKDHSCALMVDLLTLKCWGLNTSGQLGYGDLNDRGDDPNEMGNYLPNVIFSAAELPLELSLGDSSTCALSSSFQVKCWGANTAGLI